MSAEKVVPIRRGVTGRPARTVHKVVVNATDPHARPALLVRVGGEGPWRGVYWDTGYKMRDVTDEQLRALGDNIRVLGSWETP